MNTTDLDFANDSSLRSYGEVNKIIHTMEITLIFYRRANEEAKLLIAEL